MRKFIYTYLYVAVIVIMTIAITACPDNSSNNTLNKNEDFDTLGTASNDEPRGIWSDGTTMWVVDRADEKIYAYNVRTKARDAAKDFNTLRAAGNGNPHGIWSDGTTMWVVESTDDKICAYIAPSVYC